MDCGTSLVTVVVVDVVVISSWAQQLLLQMSIILRHIITRVTDSITLFIKYFLFAMLIGKMDANDWFIFLYFKVGICVMFELY
jgi:hypothetical protein